MSEGDSRGLGSGFWEIPQEPDVVWQMDYVLLPMWEKSEGSEVRLEVAWTVFCVGAPGGAVGMSRFAAEREPGLGRDVLATVAHTARHRPALIQVCDPELAADLRVALAGGGTEVELRDDLPELRTVFALYRERIAGSSLPGYLSVRGVTPERVEAFARAAARFFDAAPWRLFGAGDLLELEVVDGPAPVSLWVSVLGKLAEKALIAFEEEDETSEPRLPWVVPFLPPEQVSLDDLELWKRRDLPLAGAEAYPILLRPKLDDLELIVRPTAEWLALFEGILELFSGLTEEEVDQGEVERAVSTAGGPLHLELRVPGLPLDEEELQEIAGTDPDPRLRAENLLAQAESSSRSSLLLARRAIEIWPDSAEAYVVLGDCLQEREAALDFYRQGLAAGRRELGEERIEQEAGRLGEIRDATWYLTVLLRLGETLREVGRHEEAIVHLRELLRLDVMDGRRARYLLVDSLLSLDRREELDEIFRRYRDASAFWSWPQALLAFRREGDSPAARELLRVALRGNRFVPQALLELSPIPAPDLPLPRLLSRGSREEALFYAAHGHAHWEATPGALAWLGTHTAAGEETKKRKKRRKKHG